MSDEARKNIEALRNLRQLLEDEFITPEEYETRRLLLVNRITQTNPSVLPTTTPQTLSPGVPVGLPSGLPSTPYSPGPIAKSSSFADSSSSPDWRKGPIPPKHPQSPKVGPHPPFQKHSPEMDKKRPPLFVGPGSMKSPPLERPLSPPPSNPPPKVPAGGPPKRKTPPADPASLRRPESDLPIPQTTPSSPGGVRVSFPLTQRNSRPKPSPRP